MAARHVARRGGTHLHRVAVRAELARRARDVCIHCTRCIARAAGAPAHQTRAASLGPLVLVRLSGKRIRPGSTLGAMWAGFLLSLIFHLLPDSPGDFLERV